MAFKFRKKTQRASGRTVRRQTKKAAPKVGPGGENPYMAEVKKHRIGPGGVYDPTYKPKRRAAPRTRGTTRRTARSRR